MNKKIFTALEKTLIREKTKDYNEGISFRKEVGITEF